MKIIVEQGDITGYETDAIVNAANSRLAGGGGVDGAIHRAGGEAISRECAKIRKESGGCKTGNAVYTSGGNLLAKYVIHTVGPVWESGGKQETGLLKSCYLNSMFLAQKLSCKSIAFPNISTGVYGFPKEQAAAAVAQLFLDRDFRDKYRNIEKVIFVNFDYENYMLYKDKFGM
ncbi:MAG: O-acetyl-ADP-ribose deacetylase [Spirochaetes bacterium]|nr:O-acetyl-ADP-ribose deacetylase [Spirochaetota bacterium]MBN2772402.1 O-acetyl-ADP-ribose deacetylase [Spirochaetota bacterium]